MADRRRVWYWVGGCTVAALLFGTVAVVGLWGLAASLLATVTPPAGPVSSTQSGYRPAVRSGQLTFDMLYGSDTTGIVRFVVSDASGAVLWEVHGGSAGKPPRIVYGQVPTGWTQVVPAGTAPPSPVLGKRVRVRVDTRFQIAFGPGVEVNEGEVDVPKE